MTAVAPSVDLPRGRSARARLAPLATLATRRFQLVARTPRELLVPLLTPIMFALVIAPARMEALHTGTSYQWFVAAAALFATGMYGAAETLAARVPRQEEYIARVQAIAILPWFLAGALFPINALPGFLTWVARFLPLAHGLALKRYGLLGDSS